MIVIQEIIPRKLSGLSSLLVYPGANKEAISFLMSLDAKYEFKREYAWEIPAYELAKALDAFTPLDDVALKLLVETNIIESLESKIEWTPDFLGKPYKNLN